MKNAWLAVVSEKTADVIARTAWHALPLIERPPTVSVGDRIAVVHAPRLRSAAAASVLGTAEVRHTAPDGDLAIRHRVVAPSAHVPRVADLRELLASTGWTEERLREKVGTIEPLSMRTFDRVEGTLRDAALAFGPPAKRRTHARPRTPGRRALASARIAARRGTK